MAVVMSMHWPEATLEQYEQARKEVGWERNYPEGALFHVAFVAADGFRAIDLWNSPEQFQRFSETRLAPAIQKIGIQGQPNVTFSPVHAIFNPRIPTAGGRSAARPPRRAPARRAKAGKRKTAKKAAKAKGKKKAKR